MESAELKGKVKRVKHRFRRKELYHQWIHEDRYVYCADTYSLTGIGNYLFIGNVSDTYTNTQIENYWHGWLAEKCLAVIDRINHRILINTRFNAHTYDLYRAVPDNYEIFYTDKDITTPSIFSTGELDEVLQTYAKYLISNFIYTYLTEEYAYLIGRTKVLHDDYLYKLKDSTDIPIHHYATECSYTAIKGFVSRYKLKKKSWYNKVFDGTIRLYLYRGWSKSQTFEVPYISLKSIIDRTIFNEDESFILYQGYFYTTYCYGYGISFKDMKHYWNDAYNKKYFDKLLKRNNISTTLDNENPISWQEAVIKYKHIIDNNNKAISIRNIEQSNKNEQEAKEYLHRTCAHISVEGFREHQLHGSNYIDCRFTAPYRKYVIDSYKKGLGHWIDSKVYHYHTFDNIQLRLDNSKHFIQTTRQASVSLEEGIKMYQLYKRIADRHIYCQEEHKEFIQRFEDKHINVGIYNLRAIMYRQKRTDNNVLLDKWEWCIVIGCHYIWIDDFMDFIDYYDLYDEFNINKPIKNEEL